MEKLPYGTYRPLYTTDFRIMTGRYYRVTVNQCGWLVGDYMDINKKKAEQKENEEGERETQENESETTPCEWLRFRDSG